MPHFALEVGKQGPLLEVTICVSFLRRSVIAAGRGRVPEPVRTKLLVDTGASMSCVDVSIIDKLGLAVTGIETIVSTQGKHQVNTYDIELTVPGKPSWQKETLGVFSGRFENQSYQGLLGRDILAEARLIYCGPDNAAYLSF